MEDKRVKPSAYSYLDGMELVRFKTKIAEDDIKVPGEAVVIQALYGYRFLTKSLLEKNLALYGHESLDTDKLMPLLVKKGTVERYTIRAKNSPDIDFYTLSKKAMNENYGLFPYKAKSIPYILEDMALSQFHMSSMQGRKAKQYFHNHAEVLGGSILPIRSVLFLKTRPPLYIAAHPSPRDNSADGIKDLITELILTNDYMMQKPGIFKSHIQTVICESESQMKDLSKILLDNESTRNIYTLYSLDEEGRGSRNPLERIHKVRWDGDDAQIELVNLIA